MTFPSLIRSFPSICCPKRLHGTTNFQSIFHPNLSIYFGPLFVNLWPNLSTKFPNAFRKSQPHIASQGKPLQGKWSYIDPLLIRFSSKSCQNIRIHTFWRPSLENLVFHIRPSELTFALERRETCFLNSENGFLDLENRFLEFEIFKYWVWKDPNWHLSGF